MDKSACATCGRPRGLSPLRASWGLHLKPPIVPRTGNPIDKPAQIANDLICAASVYRNGGADANTHLCDDCLSIAIRALKVQIDELLGDLDASHDKDRSLVELTERLGLQQHRHHSACYDHNRMQARLRDLLKAPELKDAAESEALRMARWEASRKPLDDSPS